MNFGSENFSSTELHSQRIGQENSDLTHDVHQWHLVAGLLNWVSLFWSAAVDNNKVGLGIRSSTGVGMTREIIEGRHSRQRECANLGNLILLAIPLSSRFWFWTFKCSSTLSQKQEHGFFPLPFIQKVLWNSLCSKQTHGRISFLYHISTLAN